MNSYRKVKEPIHTKLIGTSLNETVGYDLPDLYLPLTTGSRRAPVGHVRLATSHVRVMAILQVITLLPIETDQLSVKY